MSEDNPIVICEPDVQKVEVRSIPDPRNVGVCLDEFATGGSAPIECYNFV